MATTTNKQMGPAEEDAWGFECENCHAESPAAPNREQRERQAGALGWGMGLIGGQAHYACSNCLPVYDSVVRFQAVDPLTVNPLAKAV